MKVTIHHSDELFRAEIALRIYKGNLTGAIDVITRDGEPETLLAVVRSYEDPGMYYCNQKYYKTYQHAYAAIGAAIDKANPEHSPLNDFWTE
jgi:hypothetical protein